MKRSIVAALGALLSFSTLACGEPENVCIGECEVPSTETDVAVSSSGGSGMLPGTGTTVGPDPTETGEPPPATDTGSTTSGATTESSSGPDGSDSSTATTDGSSSGSSTETGTGSTDTGA